MIYFDNAATGGFKPYKSIDSAYNAMKNLNANTGRSGHKLSNLASELVYLARKKVAEFLGTDSPSNIVFTQNCTHSLNLAIFGLYEKGCNVITTVTEHNSVLRPLYELERRGEISLTVIKPTLGGICAKDVKENLSPKTKLVVVSAVSNVTGQENDVLGIGKLLKGSGIYFVVDGAQAGGHIDFSIDNQLIDALCLAGHKGLLSIPGVGVLALRKGIFPRPLTFGGTGFDTFSKDMPETYPEKLEAGTLNLPAICSLRAGVEELLGNVNYVANQLLYLTEYLINKLSLMPKIKLYSIPNRYGIVSFEHTDIPSQALADLLSDKYDIAVRGGFHCAPLIHKYLKTEKLGLLRVSFSPHNTRREINALLTALDEISSIV